jgi:hypothetical protein
MSSPNYYRVRAIVRAVFWSALLAGLLAGLYLISSRLWFGQVRATAGEWGADYEQDQKALRREYELG